MSTPSPLFSSRPILRLLRPLLVLAGCAVAGSTGPPEASAQQPPAYDLLLVGGHVMDGTGNPWFEADVAVSGDRVVAIGELDGSRAKRVVDVRGKLIIPGFIDIHTHADEPRSDEGIRSPDPRRRFAPNMIAQGVTTVVANHDGRSPLPIAEQQAKVEELGTGPNTILLVGHGAVRSEVLGRDYQRPSTPEEVAEMQALVRRAMEEGAWGLSAGLEYTPGRYSTTDEVAALTREIVPWGGVYISHQRSEGADPMWYWPSRDDPGPPTLLDAVMETIEIGERTGAVVVCTHIKAKGAHYWGSSAAAIRLIQAARDRGVNVYADMYSYDTSGSDGSTVLIPSWPFQSMRRGRAEGEPRRSYASVLEEVLADPGLAADLRTDITHEIRRRGGADRVMVMDYPDPAYVGKTLGELAALRDVEPVEMALILQEEGYRDRRGGVRMRGFSMSEIDLEAYAKQPWTATASDAGIALPGDGSVHARFYGNFARKVRYFALEKGWITLEQAVRSGTSLPAQILGLKDRGVLREGAYADLAIIDPATYGDRATFFEPHQYAEGVELVLVNGRFVVEDGELTWELAGRMLSPGEDGRAAHR
ncbi:MAG: amidohydrolase family protein [bacterium]